MSLPPFPYFGGKQRIADQIVAHFPEHGHYIEPYAGGLSVLMAKRPAAMETVNDIDQDLMTFWRVLRDRPDELERACALTPHSRAESIAARDLAVADDVERARRVWVMLTQRRGGQLRTTGWRYNIDPRGTSLSIPRYLAGYLGRFPEAVERLKGVSLECRPALEVIRAYGSFSDALLYVDPPYLGTTRGSTSAYRHEMKSADDHIELAEALHQCEATVILSGYHAPLYDDLYRDWHCTTISAYTGQASRTAAAGQRTEVLWSNRPLAERDDLGILAGLVREPSDPS